MFHSSVLQFWSHHYYYYYYYADNDTCFVPIFNPRKKIRELLGPLNGFYDCFKTGFEIRIVCRIVLFCLHVCRFFIIISIIVIAILLVHS